jgi:hypothetical protein
MGIPVGDIPTEGFTLKMDGIDTGVSLLKSFFECRCVGRDGEDSATVGIYRILDFFCTCVEHFD